MGEGGGRGDGKGGQEEEKEEQESAFGIWPAEAFIKIGDRLWEIWC